MALSKRFSLMGGLKKRIDSGTTIRAAVIIFFWILMTSTATAALKIDSVDPTIGKVGEDLPITITGKGFDENTRISMSLDTGNAASIIGAVNTPGAAMAVAISGATAYVADLDGGFQIIDISDPKDPAIVGSVNLPGYAMDVAISGSAAYVADLDGGLQVIDISDPGVPTIMGSVTTPGEAAGVAISGTTAFVADGVSGLQVIDISDPGAPTIMGSVPTPGEAIGVAISGTTAYVAAGADVQVIDVSDPAAPIIMGAVNTPEDAQRVVIFGNMAYVADGAGLQVIDMSNPRDPAILGVASIQGGAHGIAISGTTAYVAAGAGLQVVDISDPEAPTILGAVNTPGGAEGVAISGTTACVAGGGSGVQLIDISSPKVPTIIGAVNTPGEAVGIVISGSMAYVADFWGGLQVIDTLDPAAPTIIGSVNTPGGVFDIAISGTMAYVVDLDGGLQVMDISDPTTPTIVGAVSTPGEAVGIAISGTTAYVAAGVSGVQVIDISNPRVPTIMGAVNTPGEAQKIAIVGTTACVADGAPGVQVIDISDPSHPILMGAVNTPGEAVDIAISSTTAYVADNDGSLQVMDISDPGAPTIIGFVNTPGSASGVTISGTTAYVADFWGGLQVIDISDPTHPTIIGSVSTPGGAVDSVILGNMAFVAIGENGLAIVPVPVEVSPVSVWSDTRLTCSLPAPGLEGNYNLRVFNVLENDEMKGAVTFLDAIDFQPKSKMKAIIVAGGGDYAGNTLWPSTRLVANQAYKTLISQGYTKENIYYLGPHSVDLYPEDGISNDVDAEATSANLSWAINSWAQDASELFVFLTDHGKAGTFQLNQNESYFPAQTLDAWLDSLQMTMPGRVVVVYDACNSGSFIPLLTPPSGKVRILITSAQANERAWFMNEGVNSFSYQFWSSAWLKGNLYDAFLDAKNMMGMDQTALLDADGDGNPTTKNDQTVAGTILIGRGRSAASLPPSIMDVSNDQTLNGETSASFWARLGTEGLPDIDSVWAVVVSPEQASVSSDIPVTNLPRVVFSDSNGDGTFEGAYAGFTQKGAYRVIVYAKDKEGLYSLPKTFTVIQQKGATTDNEKDGGYNVTSELWAKAVLQVSGAPVTLKWKEVGTDLTPSGDQVISGYFYADPKDFAYGSPYNPELFVKIYIAKNGWCNIAFNHVTVDNVTVYSAHAYVGAAQQTGTATLTNRLVEHQYNGVSIQNTAQANGTLAPGSIDAGYTLTSGLWAKAILQPSIGPVTLIWKEVGLDITPSGDKVVSGYFFADSGDFAYGSEFNPEVFVKIYIATNGWCNIAFNHVTVDKVDVYSSHNYTGSPAKSGTITLSNRLAEHPYDGVGMDASLQTKIEFPN